MRVLSVSPFHDSSVAVIEDGKILYFSKEERHNRIKRSKKPYKSLDYAMEFENIEASVIASPSVGSTLCDEIADYIESKIGLKSHRLCHKHHLQHASLAYFNSGFDECLTFVIDRQGSEINGRREAETIFHCKGPDIFDPLFKTYWRTDTADQHEDVHTEGSISIQLSNVGTTKIYESATTLIGQHGLENGKTMGLSAYGKPNNEFQEFYNSDLIPSVNLFGHKDDEEKHTYYKPYKDKETKEVTKDNFQFYADYAYQVQKQTQENIKEVIRDFVDFTQIKKVCITGGYGLNVVANGYLTKEMPDVEFYFEPLADDSGNSIGGAMYHYRLVTGMNHVLPLEHTFFHHKKETLKDVGTDITNKDIAKLLSEQKIVAVFNGLAEGGPRALGNRSILFDARNKDAKDIVNSVKNREWYRPFACSVLEEKAKDYFDMYHLKKSPFMTISFSCISNKIPGVTHVDNSCRIQTVNEDIPHLYDILKEFDDITDCPVLLNTSFNLAGDPLIETQQEAIDTFNNSKIDVLYFPELGKALIK